MTRSITAGICQSICKNIPWGFVAGGVTPEQITWGDGTDVEWGDNTPAEWSNIP